MPAGAPALSGRVGQGVLCKRRYESEEGGGGGGVRATKVDGSFAPEISRQEVHLGADGMFCLGPNVKGSSGQLFTCTSEEMMPR